MKQFDAVTETKLGVINSVWGKERTSQQKSYLNQRLKYN